MELLNITESMRNQRHYDGNTPKFGITIEGSNYIVKSAKEGYSSELFSEYVASHFIAELGLPCHETLLGVYANHLVILLKDFTSPNAVLHPFSDTRQSSVEDELVSKEYTYKDVLALLASHKKMSPTVKGVMLNRFWEMYICDAILGNRDRHAGNWGFLTTPDGYVPAPIYDNGGSLFPKVAAVISKYQTSPKDFLFERSERFPASLFKNDDLKRTNYYDVCGSIEMPNFAKSLSLQRVWDAIQISTEGIPSPYQEFYCMVTGMRYLHIIERKSLEESYEQLLQYTH